MCGCTRNQFASIGLHFANFTTVPCKIKASKSSQQRRKYVSHPPCSLDWASQCYSGLSWSMTGEIQGQVKNNCSPNWWVFVFSHCRCDLPLTLRSYRSVFHLFYGGGGHMNVCVCACVWVCVYMCVCVLETHSCMCTFDGECKPATFINSPHSLSTLCTGGSRSIRKSHTK